MSTEAQVMQFLAEASQQQKRGLAVMISEKTGVALDAFQDKVRAAETAYRKRLIAELDLPSAPHAGRNVIFLIKFGQITAQGHSLLQEPGNQPVFAQKKHTAEGSI